MENLALRQQLGGPAPISAPAAAAAVGPPVLGLAVPMVDWMEGSLDDCHTGHGRRLASPRLPPLLALEIAGAPGPAAH